MEVITATKYNGRLHLGYGDENSLSNCLGSSINSYNNSISQFVTKFFAISFDVEINGKIRCLNVNSFKKHLRSIGLNPQNIEQVKIIGYRAFVENNKAYLHVSQDKLGRVFSNEKRLQLFEKMVDELKVDNTEAVKKLIRKGAYFERRLFVCDKHKSYFLSFEEFAYHVMSYNFFDGAGSHKLKYSVTTPLKIAIEKGNKSLVQFILRAMQMSA